MLIHLNLENFKIWKSTGPIRLAPVTLLLGTNSSGKSSLIQALLLIRQTVKGGDDNQDLNLGNPDAGDSVALGQYKDMLCRFGSSNRVGIEFRWSASGEPASSTIFSARYRRGPAGGAELDYLRLGKDDQGFIVERRLPEIYRLFLGSERKSRGQSVNFHPRRSFAFSPAVLNRLGNDADPIREVGPQLLDELSRIIYLGPVRRLAQRDYVWSGRMPASIGDDGGKAVDALIASGLSLQKARKRDRTAPHEATLFKETVRWLKEMDLADDLSVKSLGGSSRYELLLHREGEVSNLKDVGVGVSQVLPVIVAALHAEPGHIVIVEEPESHLHPQAESLLAELFVTVSKERNVQFIVETHSEHLFRRMQTLLAKGETVPKNCAMYFVEREGNEAKLRELAPDTVGRIKNWPPKFFGDTLSETRIQAELAIQRIKEARAKSGDVSD
jgi:energy-coupling factor transporter ATP-binding protein EcfA2